jgi:probable HAF family extracellular repeat protein
MSVGWSTTAEGEIRAVRWDRYGNNIDIASFFPIDWKASSSEAVRINDLGQVIGHYTDSSGYQRAFVWNPNSTNTAAMDLGTFGGNETQVIAINAKGQVIGRSQSATLAVWKSFVITPSDTNGDGRLDWYKPGTGGTNALMTDIGMLSGTDQRGKYSPFGPTAVNDNGVVIGYDSVLSPGTASYYHAFGWSQEMGIVDGWTLCDNLGEVCGNNSAVEAVNVKGWAVGYSETPDGFVRAVVVKPGSCDGAALSFRDPTFPPDTVISMEDLGTLNGGTYSIARAINDTGQVAGTSNDSSGSTHAVIWDGNGPYDLGTLGGAAQPTWSEAWAMNDTFQVVGRSKPLSCPESDQTSCHHGFLWSKSTGMIDLPPLPGAYTRSWVVAVNNAGYVVGYSGYWIYPRWYTRAVLWSIPSKGPIEQLSDLIALVKKFNLAQGIANSLDSKLQNVQKAIIAVKQNDRPTSCNELGAFVNEVLAQSGKELTPDQANQMIEATELIRTALGCS